MIKNKPDVKSGAERVYPETDAAYGLTEAEARARAQAGDANTAGSDTSKKLSEILRDNICTLFNLINALIAVSLIAVGSYKNILFMGVVLCNLAIGIFQEVRAKRALDRLSLESAPTVRVLRDGRIREIGSQEVVCGDITVLSSGDAVVCDCEVIDGECDANEAFLTGEQDAVAKKAGDTLLCGSFISTGNVTAVCRKVGEAKYISRISREAKAYKKAYSEIMSTLKKIIRIISVVIFPLGTALVINQLTLKGADVATAVTNASAAIIGMIPEGLILLTDTVLAVSVIRLSKRKVLVQSLYCIETLARVDTLCIDKTGTLTEGLMEYDGLERLSDKDAERLLSLVLWADSDDNATSSALKAHFAKIDRPLPDAAIRFSSANKWSAAHYSGEGTVILGAAEKILPSIPEELAERISELSEKCRVLLLAHSDGTIEDGRLPGGITPVALITLRDKIRPSAAGTIEYFKSQGVDIRIISGDSVQTVRAVGERVGLDGCENAVDASQLDDGALAAAVGGTRIFARVSPIQKQVIIKALKDSGHTVAMTGDGVNDVLALKEADCSVALASGAGAARNISELVLTNSDFSVMPAIVDEGRRSINNIERTALLFLVKTIYSIILSIAFIFLNYSYPFIPIQLTLISSLTIGFPGFVLALEPNHDRVKPGFLRNILTRAFPGGISAAAGLIVTALAFDLFSISPESRPTVSVAIAGCIGLTVLACACYPFNKLRAALFAVVSAGLIIGLTVFGGFFGLQRLDGASWLLLTLMITFSVSFFIVLKLLTVKFYRHRKKE